MSMSLGKRHDSMLGQNIPGTATFPMKHGRSVKLERPDNRLMVYIFVRPHLSFVQ